MPDVAAAAHRPAAALGRGITSPGTADLQATSDPGLATRVHSPGMRRVTAS